MATSRLSGQAKINNRSQILVSEFRKDKYSPLIYEHPSVFRFSEVVKFHSGKSAQDCILLELTIPPSLRKKIEAGEEDLKMLARAISADIIQRYREHVTVDSIFYNYYDRLTIMYHHRSRFSPTSAKKIYSKKISKSYQPDERKEIEKKKWNTQHHEDVGVIGGLSDSGVESEQQQGKLVTAMFDGKKVLDAVLRTSTPTQTDETEKPAQLKIPERSDSDSAEKKIEKELNEKQKQKDDDGQSQNRAKSISSNRNETKLNYQDIESSMAKRIMISKFRENDSFNRSRSYLAYFSKYKSTCYEGETFLSIQTYLRNEGMFLNDEEFKSNYYEFLLDYGFSKQEIDTDLENLHNQMCTNRMLRFDQMSKITTHALTGDRQIRHLPQCGRIDPECCTLM